MPIFDDTAVGDPINIGGDKIDRLALTLCLLEPAGEVPAKMEMSYHAVARDDYLLDLALKVRDSRTHKFRCCERSGDPLGTSRRQRSIHEIASESYSCKSFVAGVPKRIIPARGQNLRVHLLLGMPDR